MKSGIFSASVILLTIWIEVCKCQEDEEVKRLQAREAYHPRGADNQERESFFPNDFFPIGGPPRPDNIQYPQSEHHHHHEAYHSHHSGRPDPDHHHHHHEHDFNSRPTVQESAGVDFSALNGSGIPLDFARTITDYTVSDLLLNFIEGGPGAGEHQLIASRFGEEEGNETERNAAQIARPAKCMPEMKTVRIAESNDPNIFFVPECTRIERCGGCCSHVLLACQPVETETVTFSVMKTEYTGNRKLKYVGKEPVLVERHTKCKCGCKIKAEDCNNYQEYKESECRCVCKNLDEERKCYKNSYVKLWNPDLCACQCREVLPCSTGFQFDYNECRCVQSQFQRRYVLTESRKEQSEPPPEQNKEYF